MLDGSSSRQIADSDASISMGLASTLRARYCFSIETSVAEWEEFLSEILENPLFTLFVAMFPLLKTNTELVFFIPTAKSAIFLSEIGKETLVADILAHSSVIHNAGLYLVAGTMAQDLYKHTVLMYCSVGHGRDRLRIHRQVDLSPHSMSQYRTTKSIVSCTVYP